ncbi:glycosyltransferase [Actinokineospora spheciospongiae]|uniref:glycosyltransferase n=1 Tax=Actinokineospora spheciospongiae TaxID=909613 RepID=UPI000D9DB1BC|nr:glycosyltransferase family 2 protein [Actinokineospora spheciospongiae]PWW66992.1 glycosyl transferase family 2 [Actinokineospora spheciospongiae]
MRAPWTTAAAAVAVGGAVHSVVNARLMRSAPTDPPPCTERVSVLLPVRDEAHRVEPTLRSLLAQRGVADLELLVLDDGSTDGTADVVRAVCGADPRVRLLTGTPPPEGVLGKPNACAQLAAEATGDVLVFVDADVVFTDQAIASAVWSLRSADLDLVSPFPRQLADGWGPRLAQPLLPWSLVVSLPMRVAEKSTRPSLAAANGQFLVVDATALRRCGGWASVSDAVLDDMALARRVRLSGGRTAAVDGSAVAECRMYEDWAQLRDGYTKSLWSATGSPLAAAVFAAVFGWLYLLPPVAALFGSRAGLVGYLAAVASRAVAARRTGGRVWPDAWAHPVSAGVVLVLLHRTWRGRRAGTLEWKGRPITGRRLAAR